MDKYQKKSLIIITFLIVFLVPLAFIFFNGDYHLEEYAVLENEDTINTQSFSKDDYEPIIEDDKLSYGNITVLNFEFDEVGFTSNSERYGALDDDFASGALIVEYNETNYIETAKIAQIDNLDASVKASNKITVLLNDTLTVIYNQSLAPLEGFLIYGPRLTPCSLTKLLILNSAGSSVDEVGKEYYSTDNNSYLVFDYDDYFTESYKRFELYLIWEYNITIEDWNMEQRNDQEIFIKNEEQTVNPLFGYNFTVRRRKFGTNISENIVNALNLDLYLKLSLADKEDLFDHSLKIGENFVSNYLNVDKSINITIVSNLIRVYLNFTSNFTLKFLDPVAESWSIDRLVNLRNIRERIYFPSIIEGPKHYVLKNLYIHEKTITVDQVIANYSLFERFVQYYDINVSVVEEELRHSLIITRNAIKKKGLKIVIPFLIKGETNPFSIKYEADNDLRVIIADNIFMPLVGIKVEFYYFGKPFGTYISNEKVLPISPIISNENGEVVLRGAPNGNYTLRLYQENQILMETIVSTFSSVNYVSTDILHFPIWIIIFGLINGVFILIGFIVYYKYRNRN